ncbi:MAG: hypothetical protein U5L45_26170 [Saprospiraceae bacterium]|nr:hypothetical protein [Saprospiraceae bacterium]
MPEKRTTFPFFASEASYGLSNYFMTTKQAILGTIPNTHLNAVVNIKITHGWVCKPQDDFF